jgi:hypothetical protein
MYIGIVLSVLIVFSLRRELLKLILFDEPPPRGRSITGCNQDPQR